MRVHFDEDERWWTVGADTFLVIGCAGVVAELLWLPLSLLSRSTTALTAAGVAGGFIGAQAGHDLFLRARRRLARRALAAGEDETATGPRGGTPAGEVGRRRQTDLMGFQTDEGWWTVGAHMFFALGCGFAAAAVADLPLSLLFGGAGAATGGFGIGGMVTGDRAFTAMRQRWLRRRRAACDVPPSAPDASTSRADA